MMIKKKIPAKVACVHCNGGTRSKTDAGGHTLCAYGCNACGTCISACRFGAIALNAHGVAEVDESKCIGCGACCRACPRALIHLHFEEDPIAVLCSNHDAACREICTVSCIGCGLCEKRCPAGAIQVLAHCAVIDADKCLSCGACAVACPRSAIRDLRGILTPRN